MAYEAKVWRAGEAGGTPVTDAALNHIEGGIADASGKIDELAGRTTGSNSGDQTSVSGNAGTATKLAVARTINGVPFDGTANIQVEDGGKVPADATGVPEAGGLWAPNLRMPRFPAASSTVTQFQSGHGWGGSTGFVANDSADYIVGAQSAKMVTGGTGGTHNVQNTGLSLDTTGQQIRIRVKYENMAHIFTTQFIVGNDTGYANCYTWLIAAAVIEIGEVITEGEWVTITLPFSSATVTGNPTRTGIVAAKLTVRDDNKGESVTAHINSVELVPEPESVFPNGLVSVTFDDSWLSPWSLGKAKMDASGVRATYFLIDDLVGQGNRLSRQQVLELQRQGNEICAHSLTLADHATTFTGLSVAELDADMRTQVAVHRAHGYRGQGTAYPLGKYGPTTDGGSTIPTTRRYFSYARTTSRRQMETFPPVEPFRIRSQSAISSVGGGYSASNVIADIDKAKANKSWLVLTFHNLVSGSPSATTECSVADFNSIMDKIVSSGVACMPMGEALAYYG